MCKRLGILTSSRPGSKSKEFLMDIKAHYSDQMCLLNFSEFEVGCNGCNQCKDDVPCARESNRLLLEAVMEAETIVFAFPIYYGGLSGKSKMLLEAFYSLKSDALKNKSILFVLSAEKEDQEGIAVLELLPWAYKHGANISAIVNLHHGMSSEDRSQVYKDVISAIDQKVCREMDLGFTEFHYFQKTVFVPKQFIERKSEVI